MPGGYAPGITVYQDALPPAEVSAVAPLPASEAPGTAFFEQVGAVLAILREDGSLLIGPEQD